MLTKIAWRNIWRNPLRTTVLILSIAFGLWAGIFSMGLMKGMSDTRIDNALMDYVSHLQIHHPEFQQERELKYYIESRDEVTGFLDTLSGMRGYASRMLAAGMVSTANGASGAVITGIDPEREQTVTSIHNKIITGTYFEGVRRNQILIGRKLADKLKARERSKVILTFQDAHGELASGAFRVAGIFESSNSTFDASTVFVRRHELIPLAGLDAIHEVAVLLDEVDRARTVRNRLADRFPGLQIDTWAEIAPEMSYMQDVLDQSMYIFVTVILLAMAFGIVNSMLMAVLERRHEIGMLLCIGMSQMAVFRMIVIETLLIIAVGAPTGLLMASGSFAWFGKRGIDLSVVGDGLKTMGFSTVIYPALELKYFLNVLIMVIITSLISALYPARKAVKYNPVDAIRSL